MTGGGFDVAPTLDAHYGDKQGLDNQHIDAGGGYSSVAKSLNSHGGRFDYETETFVTVGPLQSGGTPNGHGTAGVNRHAVNSGHVIPLAFDCKASGQNGFGVGEIASTLRSMGHSDSHQNGGGYQAVCFDTTQITSKANRSNPQPGDPCHPLCAGAYPPSICRSLAASGAGSSRPAGQGNELDFCVTLKMAVRRLTPRECERLMGHPDDSTLIEYRGKPAADGPRYKALGNSMVVNELRWIGERIAMVERMG